ncbi:MAG: hypothetical protein V7K25_30655 [Nostoc sp.]|uniref:hypothetical protein n=1 Tax=Nostoc sp. TaxID=1180 RepID=UPI002FFBC52A
MTFSQPLAKSIKFYYGKFTRSPRSRSIANNGIGVITPDRCYQILVTDEKLSWTDSLTLGLDGYIYLDCNQLHRSAPLNAGENTSIPPYYIFRLKPFTLEVA